MTTSRLRRATRFHGAHRWLPVTLLAGAALAPGCGPEFTDCEARRSCAPATGAGGTSGGRAGGTGTSGAGMAGADAGGTNAGSGSGAGGEGGHAEPCTDEGAVECDAAASPRVRTCSSGVWIIERCAGGALCDSSDATCRAVIEGCVGHSAGDAFCEGIDKRRVCGPDLVTTTDQVCDGVCLAGSCKKPACGDGKLQGGESCDDGNTDAGDDCSASCGSEPIALELGHDFGCALLADKRLKCWGENASGQLGQGDLLARGDSPDELGANLKATLGAVSAFAVGSRHACAVSKAETWCWGDNSHYALGTGSLAPQFSPVPLVVALGATPLALAAGEDFTCALLEDQSLRCWGSNVGGVFGGVGSHLPLTAQTALPRIVLGTGAAQLAAGLSLCARAASGLTCSGARFPSAAFDVPLGAEFELAGVSSGSSHDCAWSSTGGVKCWGKESNTLGLNGVSSLVDGLSSAPLVPLNEAASALDVGVASTCAVVGPGSVECWGATRTGALGRPELDALIGPYLGDAAGEMAELHPLDLGADGLAKAISVGDGFACALLQRGAIKCWGNNQGGQLGQGNTETKGDDPGEMAEALPETELD